MSSLPGTTPLSVHFINHRLPETIPEFSNADCHYDTMMQQYVPNPFVVAPSTPLYPLRNEVETTAAMQFWQGILTDALKAFKDTRAEPKGRNATGYSIREKNDWDAIYSVLESARAQYQRAKGPMGTLRSVRRKLADHIAPLAGISKTASKLVPDNVYATPVLGAVEVVLDVSHVIQRCKLMRVSPSGLTDSTPTQILKTAAKVRNEALSGLDDLIPVLSDVELFLGTFQGDIAIRKASVYLTVSIIDAVERSIGFFISNEGR